MDWEFGRQLIWALVAVGCVLLGYVLGRNSAEKPILNDSINITQYRGRLRDPVDEPEGDIINDAMRGDDDARYPTMGEQ